MSDFLCKLFGCKLITRFLNSSDREYYWCVRCGRETEPHKINIHADTYPDLPLRGAFTKRDSQANGDVEKE